MFANLVYPAVSMFHTHGLNQYLFAVESCFSVKSIIVINENGLSFKYHPDGGSVYLLVTDLTGKSLPSDNNMMIRFFDAETDQAICDESGELSIEVGHLDTVDFSKPYAVADYWIQLIANSLHYHIEDHPNEWYDSDSDFYQVLVSNFEAMWDYAKATGTDPWCHIDMELLETAL